MRAVLLLIFVAFIPTFAVLGHDAYLHYEESNMNGEFELSTLGYMLTEYAPEQHKEILELIDGGRNPKAMEDAQRIAYEEQEQEKRDILNAVLNRKAIELAAALGVVLSSLIIVIKLIVVLFSSLNDRRFKSKRKHR